MVASMPVWPSNPDQNAIILRKKNFLTAAIAGRAKRMEKWAAPCGLPEDCAFRENSGESQRCDCMIAAAPFAHEPC